MIKRLLAILAVTGVTILSMVCAPATAWAGKRVALIVGNSTYQTVPQLPNPARDATSVAKMFKDAGFDSVELQLDVGNLEFKRAIRRFETTADQADIAVVYYAGHGLEIGGTNYLIPTDARLASDRDADDEAIPLERLVSSADGAKRLRLVILDACRDNPFVRTMRRESKVASRGVSGGLGRVEPTSTDTLIAYAAKAGSTADDGDGQHSPFTTAILKNLPVPGLDVRLAFGRVRDEVLKTTANRQEPFVYGSLGGGNVSLVPAPAVPQEVPVTEVKSDYELVQKIGTQRAWEVFLGTHPTGFYAELAKAQIERIKTQPVNPPPGPPNVVLAALPPQQAPSVSRDASSKEAIEWDRVKDATDPAALQKFIKRFPDSPLAANAQQKIDVLKKAAQEREDQARAAREAAQKAAEEARRKAEQEKAEQAAQKKREDDERRAREAEAAEKAKAAAAQLAAQKKREEEEKHAAAAEAVRQAKEAEAARKAQEAKDKAEQAEREKAAAEAAAARAAAEKQASAAEAARQAKEAEAARKAQEAKDKAEQAEREKAAAEAATARAAAEKQAKEAEAARKAQEAKEKAERAEREKAAAEAAAARAAAEKQAKEAEAARKQAELAAAKEAACKDEQGRFDAILARGSEGSGINDLKGFSKTVTCGRLGPAVIAALDRFNAEATTRAANEPNSPQLLRSAQGELIRLGCFTGKADGALASTQAALSRYLSIEGQRSANPAVTKDAVAELTKHATRVCPIECKSGETLKGDTCVADQKPAAPPAAASRKHDENEDNVPSRRKHASREAEREPPPRRQKPAQVEAPQVRQQALARPSIVPSAGGGAHTMIGVGF